jgi:hypothetical protein
MKAVLDKLHDARVTNAHSDRAHHVARYATMFIRIPGGEKVTFTFLVAGPPGRAALLRALARSASKRKIGNLICVFARLAWVFRRCAALLPAGRAAPPLLVKTVARQSRARRWLLGNWRMRVERVRVRNVRRCRPARTEMEFPKVPVFSQRGKCTWCEVPGRPDLAHRLSRGGGKRTVGRSFGAKLASPAGCES